MLRHGRGRAPEIAHFVSGGIGRSTLGPGSPADKIGLRRGDEILASNGKRIADMRGGLKRGGDLFELLVDQPVGRMTDFAVAVRVAEKPSCPRPTDVRGRDSALTDFCPAGLVQRATL